MPIVRVKKDPGDFFLMSKEPIEDPGLSWKAKGMLAYLMSKPSDWQIWVKDLVKRSVDGRDAVLSGLTELISQRYAAREQPRREDGTLGPVEYVVYESPQTGFPYTVKPLTDNPIYTNNDYSKNDHTKNEKEHGPEPKPITEHFEDVMELLRKGSSQKEAIAATAEFCALCFGGAAEYGRIGRIRKARGHQFRRICQVALESVAKSPRGDPYSYLEACLKGDRGAKEKQGSHARRSPKHHVADRAEFEQARREIQERKAAEAGG